MAQVPVEVYSGFNLPYVQEIYVPTPKINSISSDFDSCSCVSGAKYILGVPQSEIWGNADQIKPNTDKPTVGGLILLNEGVLGHVSVILNWTDTTITFEEYNAIPCKKSVRQVPRDYSLIRGYRIVK